MTKPKPKTKKPAPTSDSTTPASATSDLEAMKTFISMRTVVSEPPCKLVDLSEKGPVLLLRSRKGPGLLITHENGPDSITLVSLASGQGFTLSKDAARLLGPVLAEWAGPEESGTASYVEREDRWELAK